MQPAGPDTLVSGCVRWLRGHDDIRTALGRTTDTDTPWIFQHAVWAPLEGSGQTAAVLSRAGGWAGGNPHNSLRFPRLSVELYADPHREALGNPVDPGETHDRLETVWEVFDRLLHRAGSGTQMWGTVRTIDSVRLAEPVTYPVPDGDGMLRSQCFYAVTVG